MSLKSLLKLSSSVILKDCLTYSKAHTWYINICQYAAAAKAAKVVKTVGKKVELPVESDANKLSSRLCGGNIYTTGEDPVLQPDSEYPDWLWNLKTDKHAIPLEELNKDDIRYWRRLKKLALRERNSKRYAKRL